MFEQFVNAHLELLDDLTMQYRNYWARLVEGYWEELCDMAGREKREGFTPKISREIRCGKDTWCGWARDIDGTEVSATIVVGRSVRAFSKEVQWHAFANSWIGIVVNSGRTSGLWRRARDGASGVFPSAEEDADSPAWQRLQFSRLNIREFHSEITERRFESQKAIIAELKSWAGIVQSL